MKYSLLLVVLLQSLNIQLYAQNKKVAVVSIFIDKFTNQGMNDQRNKSNNPDDLMNYDSIITTFKSRFFEQYATALPVDFLAEDSVTKAAGYAELGEGQKVDSQWSRFTTAEGYVLIDSRWSSKDKDAIQKAFAVLPKEVDFIMISYLSFSVTASSTVNNIRYFKINAFVKMKAFDRSGDEVFKIQEAGKSEDELAEVSHSGWTMMDYAGIRPLSFQALDKMYLDLEKDLPKDVKKIQKKIAKWEKKQAKK